MGSEKKETLIDKLKAIKACEIMSRYAITSTEDASISQVAHLMMRFKISGIPIVTDDKDLMGIMTVTDLFNYMQKLVDDMDQGKNPIDDLFLPTSEFMTKEVVVVSESENLFEIIKIMLKKKVHTLPVISKGEVVGIIGRHDVMNACYSADYVGVNNDSVL